MNILHALDDPKVFGPFFKGDTWAAWRVFLAALFALPMTAEQIAIYRQHTGRTAPPSAAIARSVADLRQTQSGKIVRARAGRGLPRMLPRLASVSRSGRARHGHGYCRR